MNHVRKAAIKTVIIMDAKQLLRYMEFAETSKTNGCSLRCDDCDGSCVKRKYTPMPSSPPLQPLTLTQYK